MIASSQYLVLIEMQFW